MIGSSEADVQAVGGGVETDVDGDLFLGQHLGQAPSDVVNQTAPAQFLDKFSAILTLRHNVSQFC